jgi:hypothetical protein
MKQIEEQKRRIAASSSDTPLMTLQAMQQAQQKTGSAYIVLSSGAFTRGVMSTATTTNTTSSAEPTLPQKHEKGGFSEVTNVTSSHVSSNTKVEFDLKAKAKGPLQNKLK